MLRDSQRKSSSKGELVFPGQLVGMKLHQAVAPGCYTAVISPTSSQLHQLLSKFGGFLRWWYPTTMGFSY